MFIEGKDQNINRIKKVGEGRSSIRIDRPEYAEGTLICRTRKDKRKNRPCGNFNSELKNRRITEKHFVRRASVTFFIIAVRSLNIGGIKNKDRQGVEPVNWIDPSKQLLRNLIAK